MRNPQPVVRRAERQSLREQRVSGRCERPQNRRMPKPVPKVTLGERAGRVRAWFGAHAGHLKRALGLLWRTSVALVIISGLVSVSQLVERHLHASPSFAIDTIVVTGNQRLSRDAVIEASGLKLGQNVFELSPEVVRHRLMQQAWIEAVDVHRSLPSTYDITLRERRAVALLAVPELYLVSEDGVAFKTLAPGDPYDLPVITGIAAAQLGADRRASASALVSAVALLHDYQDAGLWRRESISEIHIEPDGGLSLYVGFDATHVQLGKPPFRDKLERLREIVTLLRSQKARAAYVLLDNQRRLDRVTVRLR